VVVEQGRDRVGQLVGGASVGVESDAVPGLVDPLGVVVLVPEQRQHDHRLAEVHRLGRCVVATVGDDEVHEGQDVCLRKELGDPHVRQRVLGMLRAGGDDEAVCVCASISTSRRIRSTSALPREPSDR